jgi:2-(1,2-epoxy-1,2-dihydrophenyl)acetyl-CoA isomerase
MSTEHTVFSYEAYEDMRVELSNGVLIVTLDNPDRLNALSTPIRHGLKRVLSEFENDDSAKVMVITGEGRGFCSGADLGNTGSYKQIDTRKQIEETRFEWINRFRSINKPIIAAVNGVAAGGGVSLALAADIRVASDKARFVTAFLRRAILPDNGATWFLPRIVGVSKALLMLWLSDDVGAEESLQIGLVDKVVPHDSLMDETMALANRLAEGPSITLELTKKAVYHSLNVDLITQCDYEENLGSIVHNTEDNDEGRLAFREKRKPNFKGR